MSSRMPFTVLALGAAGLLSACAGTPHAVSLALPAAPQSVASTTPAPLAAPLELSQAAAPGFAADALVAAATSAITPASFQQQPQTAKPATKPNQALAARAVDPVLGAPKVALDVDRQIRVLAWQSLSSANIALIEATQNAELADLSATPAPVSVSTPAPVRKLPAVPPLPSTLAMDLTPLPKAEQTARADLPMPAPVPPTGQDDTASLGPEPQAEASAAPSAPAASNAPPAPQEIAELAAPVTPRRRPAHRVAQAKRPAHTGEGGPDIPLTFELRHH